MKFKTLGLMGGSALIGVLALAGRAAAAPLDLGDFTVGDTLYVNYDCTGSGEGQMSLL